MLSQALLSYMFGVVIVAGADAVPAPMPTTAARAASVARDAVARCLAVGLTTAVHAGRYRWEGAFRLDRLIDRNGWDVLDHPAECDTAGPAEPATT